MLQFIRNIYCIRVELPEGNTGGATQIEGLIVLLQKGFPPEGRGGIGKMQTWVIGDIDHIAGVVCEQIPPYGHEDMLVRVPTWVPFPEMKIDPGRGRQNPVFVIYCRPVTASENINLIISERLTAQELVLRCIPDIPFVVREMSSVLEGGVDHGCAHQKAEYRMADPTAKKGMIRDGPDDKYLDRQRSGKRNQVIVESQDIFGHFTGDEFR